MNFSVVTQITIPEGSVYRIYSGSTLLWSKESGPTYKLVQDLINEGYARVVTGSYGNYVEILSNCPYPFSQITDLEEVARNEKQLTSGSSNVIVWNQVKPSGWTDADLLSIYTSESLNFTPRGEMFWGLGNSVASASVEFAGGEWIAADYPWGSYQSEGIFAPRWNQDKEAEYTAKGFRNTPAYVEVTINGVFSSVAQVMFTEMKTTDTLVLNLGDVFVCHDIVGMFEANNMTNLIINGPFRWDAIRTCLNVFDGCNNLLSIPYVTSWGRTSSYNTIYPRFDGTRGTANVRRIFNASSLTSIGPVFNMNAIHLSGSSVAVDGYAQDATSETIFNCPDLTDVRIQNLGNNSWSFVDDSTKTYIPNMDAASINYLLDNIKDETGNGYSVTFSTLHQAEVSASSIATAQGRGWNVQFVSSSQDYQLLYLQNGVSDPSTQKDWSINTGINWRNIFASGGLAHPGLEVTTVFSVPYLDGSLTAGNLPRSTGPNEERDTGGFWRLFNWDAGDDPDQKRICFDCPSEDDRAYVENAQTDTVYTAIQKYYEKSDGSYETSLEVPELQEVSAGEPMSSWRDALNGYDLYLFSDNIQSTGDTCACGGTRIYRYTVWTLESGVRSQKIYDGIPWMHNGVPCIKDLVSGQLQYNCASSPQPFLYGTI